MVAPTRPPANSFVATARKVYNPFGFSKGYNFVLWFIFAGAMIGFCLARFSYLDVFGTMCPTSDPSGTNDKFAPGECFYYRQKLYGVGIVMHLAGILPAAFLAVLQFTPIIRYKAMIFHRANGYLVFLLVAVGLTGGIIITPKAQGGSFDVQMWAGLVSIIFVGSLVMAYVNIKRLQIEQHRIWMLRAWFYGGTIITERIIQGIAINIISYLAPIYISMPCDKLDYLMGGQNATLSTYPACSPFYSGETPSIASPVRADVNGATNAAEAAAGLAYVFGGCLWLALIMHGFGVETYIRLTPNEHERLRRLSYKRQVERGFRHPGMAGLTVDRFGDAEKWTPPVEEQEQRGSTTTTEGLPLPLKQVSDDSMPRDNDSAL